MPEGVPLSLCVHCGATRCRILGNCKICHALVCTSCGSTQITQTEGTFHVHSACFESNLEEIGSAFQFIKFRKPDEDED